ncbi:hypothetical protein ACSBPU_15770 [Parapusillimonas sp. JC17]
MADPQQANGKGAGLAVYAPIKPLQGPNFAYLSTAIQKCRRRM